MSDDKMVTVRVLRAHDGFKVDELIEIRADRVEAQIGFGWVTLADAPVSTIRPVRKTRA